MLEYEDLSGNGQGVGFVKRAEIENTFDAVENGTPIGVKGQFNASLRGTFVGTFKLQRSYDDGLTFHNLTALGGAISFTGPCEEAFVENEDGVLYRWSCTAYTSGTAIGRISQ